MNDKPIPFFKRFVIQNFPFIEEDFDALMNYQLFCKVVEYLNKVIGSQNEVTQQMEYVLNYFNNLDVQDEINNKLDQMAESGELTDLIAGYLNLRGILAYDTVAAMKTADNLVDGSFAETYGFYAKGDMGGAKYKIRAVTNADTVDEMTLIALADESLVAELIDNGSMNIRQFGAYGDDTHDDSSVISHVLNNYKNVLFSNGVYLIESPITINNNNLRIKGETSSVIHSNTGGHALIFNGNNNITIENMTFTAPEDYTAQTAHDTHHLLKMSNCNNIIVKSCNFNHGVLGLTIENSSHIIIEKNTVSYFTGWGIMLGYNQTSIKNAKILNNTSTNSSYDGIKMTGYIEDILVEGNNCYDNSSDGFDFAGHTAKNVIITNNIFSNNNINGCDFKQLTRTDYPYDETKTKQFFNITISNNVLSQNLNHHINMQLWYDDVNIHNIYIVDNNINLKTTVTANSGTGIRISPCVANTYKAVLIKNNNITSENSDNYDYGIRISAAKNIYVENNFISGAMRTGIYIDNGGDATATSEYITVIKNTIYNMAESSAYCVNGDSSVSNCVVRENLFKNNYAAYFMGFTLITVSTNILIDNRTIDTFTEQPSTLRANKFVIYPASDPITAGCIGWIGNANGTASSSRYTTYIPLS